MNYRLIFTFLSLIITTSAPFIRHPATPSQKIAAAYKDSLKQTVRQLADSFMQNKHISLAIGIFSRGEGRVFSFGAMDAAGTRPTAPNTIYEIASVTKTFTGTLLAQALLEKKINLDDDVRKYLPQLANLSFSGVPVTVRNLANHTAGLPKFVPDLPKNLSPAQAMAKYDQLTEREFLSLMQKVKLDAVPGSKFNYSNADAQLTGILLEKIYHKPYGELLKKYITKPLKMTDTKLDVSPGDQSRFPGGYNNAGEVMPRLTWWKRLPAAGYIKSTPADMLKYVQFNLDEKNPAVKLAHQPIYKTNEEGAEAIGLYWFNKKAANGVKGIYHAGGSFGSASYCLLCPDRNTGVIILCNFSAADTEQHLKKMADVILARLK